MRPARACAPAVGHAVADAPPVIGSDGTMPVAGCFEADPAFDWSVYEGDGAVCVPIESRVFLSTSARTCLGLLELGTWAASRVGDGGARGAAAPHQGNQGKLEQLNADGSVRFGAVAVCPRAVSGPTESSTSGGARVEAYSFFEVSGSVQLGRCGRIQPRASASVDSNAAQVRFLDETRG